MLLDYGKWVQEVIRHGTTKLYSCRMIWQGGPGPLTPLWIRVCVLMFSVFLVFYSHTTTTKTVIPTRNGSRVVHLRHVKEPQAEIRASEQNLSDFSRSLQKVTLMTWDVKSVVNPQTYLSTNEKLYYDPVWTHHKLHSKHRGFLWDFCRVKYRS